ncbi:MAG TPA: hypothetical protein VEJ38_16570 [Candidatus Acidoferrales bacterium]|nr:hypothetical protein [Candidatus Acidoferrales bacterium]
MKSPGVKLAALAIGLALASALGHPQSQRYPALDWTSTSFQAAFEDFFPTRNFAGDFIAVRAHQNGSNEAPEFSFILENTQDPHAIRATLREAQGVSLYQQLAALHAKDPARSYEDMKPELKVQTWSFTVAQCPAVQAQYNAFENIQFVRPRDEDEPDENPIVYEISETVAGGSSQVIEFMPMRAIPRWAVATHAALRGCAGLPPTSGSAGSDKKD